MSTPHEYTIIQPGEFEFTPPSKGDQRRGVMRLSEHLDHSRANIWHLPPESRGRRHRETTQEEIFVTLEGTATLLLGEPPIAIDVPQNAVAIVRPHTAVQLANQSSADATILIIGAPATVGDAEYLVDVDAGAERSPSPEHASPGRVSDPRHQVPNE